MSEPDGRKALQELQNARNIITHVIFNRSLGPIEVNVDMKVVNVVTELILDENSFICNICKKIYPIEEYDELNNCCKQCLPF